MHNARNAIRRQGFTMIEAMIVLVIMMVTAAAAYPSYAQFVVRGKRTEAQASLYLLMQQQERYFSVHNSYLAFSSSSTDADERKFKWWTGVKAADSAYEVEGKACDGEEIGDCVQLIAKPGTAQVDANYKDAVCESLILTSAGERKATGASTGCWR
ncbi:type IV pilin protein [Pseudoduganella namucuonensis]|uniref:Type IV pilus assembly protein PilE n=1 Tax=Pseudoduganella namucuonensis TaxID=1035707 RepID=A0A1I7KVP7_9BURK|nr:type IV pilin protein [Pseudoduganella namucuonensis]SFV01529.1 type IV pilus assembly protein PilE [Pseudoduganella namucuonensis]